MLAALAPAARASTVTPPPPEHHADPSLTTYVERSGPFEIGPYDTLIKTVGAKPPPVAGAIVGMDVRLVDASGAVIPQWITMLHHVVFTNGGPDDQRTDPECPLKSTRERFFGTSEELRPLTMPPGYGYPTNPADIWHSSLMVMHHRSGVQQFWMEYRVTVDPRPTIPVKPYWLSIVPCSPDPQWTVPGNEHGEARRSALFTMPEDGRIVAAGAHLHGGADQLVLSQPSCAHRTLVASNPYYAPAGDRLYKVNPLLHEPDPKAISWWQSPTGWAVHKGQQLKVTALYNGSRVHSRVMGIDHIYVAPPLPGAERCAAPPPDATILGADFPDARLKPPTVNLTLARVGSSGKARAVTSAAGKPKVIDGGFARVKVAGFAYNRTNLTVARGTRVVWSFDDNVNHDVTVARGPVGFGSPWSKNGKRYAHDFDQPGTYLLQCSLHAAYMSQVVHVTSKQASKHEDEASDASMAMPDDSDILW